MAKDFDPLNGARTQTQSGGRVVNTQANPPKSVPDDPDFLERLASKVWSFVKLSDSEEDARRRTDRIGANLYYSRHWQVAVSRNRAAITCNIAKPLVDHAIGIMTKQEPVWVVQPDDVGDVHGARLMRSVLQHVWRGDNMMKKSRQALRLSMTTRTIGAKTLWDPTKKGGAGDITTDIVPGWRMILDPRTSEVERMEFIGDRAIMSRSRAMLLYPDAAHMFAEAGNIASNSVISGGTAQSPASGPYSGNIGVDSPSYGGSGGTIVNGQPVVTAFTSRSPSAGSSEFEVEICEVYYRDRSLVEKEVPVKDEFGEVQRQISFDIDGAPLFTQDGEWDEVLGEPGFKLVYEEVTEKRMVPKYPQWRRTTLLMPDMVIVDDTAWDAVIPYSLLNDNEPLEGAWGKGTILEAEDLQATLNVSLSTMLDNLRFSAYRAFKASNTAQIEKNNLVISPGDIIRTGNDVNQFEPLIFPEVSQAWFGWVNLCISLMERVFGLEGIMQGSAKEAPRTDSAKGFDSLAEIGGSRIVEKTQRFERWLSEIGMKVGYLAQNNYTEEHALRVESLEGEITWERASSPQLAGTFSYNVAVGSTMAWSQSAVRGRVLEEYGLGLRDMTSVWKNPAVGIDDWEDIRERKKTEPPQLQGPPAPRQRQQVPKAPKPKAPPRNMANGQYH